MVRKVQKAKAVSLKPSTSVKKNTTKAKNEEKLSNGFKDNENGKAESKTEMKIAESKAEIKTAESIDEMETTENETSESVEEMDTTQDSQESGTVEENVTDIVKQEEPVETKDVTSDDVKKEAPRSRKRRAAVDVKDKKEPSKTTKAKKQKVLIEIPKISSISGKVFVVGDNQSGQLGFEESIEEKKKPTLLELPYSIVDIAAGAMHSVCLTESGEVITFGCNDEGALGRTTSEEGSECSPRKIDIPEHIVQISAGDSHSAALSESGQVYIWGNFRNGSGSMGLVADDIKQYTPVKILNNVTVVKISSGSDHLTCLSQEGVVYSCGAGEAGQLGRVSEHASVDGGRKGRTLLLTPDKVPIAKSDRSSKVNSIWTGSFGTFVKIQESGSIYAFGLNNFDQLGVENPDKENPENIFKPKKITSFNNKTWQQIGVGLNHTLALDDNGSVYSLGRSEYGRLGLGENCGNKSVPTAIPSLQDKNCVDISCGTCVSFAITDNGSVFSFGMGSSFQLGHGDDSDQHTPKLIEGNFFNSWKAVKVSGGGQHTLILAQPRKSLEESQ